jgi:effector-binding domain-containing protein
MRKHKEILENQGIDLENLLSFRLKGSTVQLQKLSDVVSSFIEKGGYKKTGPTISATYSVETNGNTDIIDFELLIPLDRSFIPPDGCIHKERFSLKNAISIRHIGNPQSLQDTCNILLSYIQQNGLQPITVGYNVTVDDTQLEIIPGEVIIDVYIGLSPNLL